VNSFGNNSGGIEKISVLDLRELNNIHTTGKHAYTRPIISPKYVIILRMLNVFIIF
jgi:hypothetical protein